MERGTTYGRNLRAVAAQMPLKHLSQRTHRSTVLPLSLFVAMTSNQNVDAISAFIEGAPPGEVRQSGLNAEECDDADLDASSQM